MAEFTTTEAFRLMQQPNARTLVEVTRDELPIHCPTPDSSLWNSHPRVFIPLEEAPEATCAYCGTVYRLVTEKSVVVPAVGTGTGTATSETVGNGGSASQA